MLLNLKTLTSSTVFEISERMASIDSPAVLTDGKLVILKKNHLAASATTGSRKGGKLDRFLRAADIDILLDMSPREMFSTELRFNDALTHDTLAIAGAGWRLFVFIPVGAGLLRRVDELYGKMSGYDIAPEGGVDALEYSPNKRFARLLSKTIFASAEEFKRVRGLPVFNAASVLDTLKNCIYESRDGTRNTVELSRFSRELLTEGNARDLALLMGYLVSFCLDICGESKVFVKADATEDLLTLTVGCNSALDSFELARLSASKRSTPDIDDRNFWLYMVRLLADGNLWDMSVDVALDGSVAISLALPRVAYAEELMLRDSHAGDVWEILSQFFPKAG